MVRNSSRRLFLALGASSLASVFVGCETHKRVPMPPPEMPWMNLPRELREWNWGGGSCVHASMVHNFRWQGRPELATKWRKTYSGGESSYGLRAKLDHAGIQYCSTETGDVKFLDWCSRSRRGAVIFFFPNHSINFCGYSNIGGQDMAMLLDNNRIEHFLQVPKDSFITSWRGYGGFALSPTLAPSPRLPYQPFRVS